MNKLQVEKYFRSDFLSYCFLPCDTKNALKNNKIKAKYKI